MMRVHHSVFPLASGPAKRAFRIIAAPRPIPPRCPLTSTHKERSERARAGISAAVVSGFFTSATNPGLASRQSPAENDLLTGVKVLRRPEPSLMHLHHGARDDVSASRRLGTRALASIPRRKTRLRCSLLLFRNGGRRGAGVFRKPETHMSPEKPRRILRKGLS